MLDPCHAKKFYDTEFEAERASSLTGYYFTTEFIHYLCPLGNHWHIANKYPEMRSKRRKVNRTWCDLCKCYLKPNRWDHHITMSGHKRKETPKGL